MCDIVLAADVIDAPCNQITRHLVTLLMKEEAPLKHVKKVEQKHLYLGKT